MMPAAADPPSTAAEGDTSTARPWLVLVPLLFAIGSAVDLLLDAPTSWRSAHVLFELMLLAVSLGFAGYLWLAWRRAARTLGETRRDLIEREEAHAAERANWRREAQAVLAGMGRAIDRQFDAWGLTAAEREVALLVLKGHGHKQIAARSGRSERTVRQHAVSVYGKSGLDGRAELAAFFLQDLLPGGEARDPHEVR